MADFFENVGLIVLATVTIAISLAIFFMVFYGAIALFLLIGGWIGGVIFG